MFSHIMTQRLDSRRDRNTQTEYVLLKVLSQTLLLLVFFVNFEPRAGSKEERGPQD
jgi:hypothetical protein